MNNTDNRVRIPQITSLYTFNPHHPIIELSSSLYTLVVFVKITLPYRNSQSQTRESSPHICNFIVGMINDDLLQL